MKKKTEPCGTPTQQTSKIRHNTINLNSLCTITKNMTELAVVHYRQFRHIFSSMYNKLSWSIVSQAADKSRRTRNDPLPFPTVVSI